LNSVIVSCPKCFSSNRVAETRLVDAPKCGKCKSKLFTGRPMMLTAANAATVLRHNELPLLVDCWAPWCAPCRSFASVFEQATALYEPHLRLAKLDTQAHPNLSTRWQIRSIPTLLLFRNGKEVDRVSGALSLTQLQRWLAQSNIVAAKS
jgi:thioredoxin 2